MPRCKEISARAVDFMEGRLSWRERAAYGLHLATCRNCRAELAQMKCTVALLGRLPPLPPSEPAPEALFQAFRAAWQPARMTVPHSVAPAGGWIVSGVLALMALILGALQIRTWGPFLGWHLPCPIIELAAGLTPAVAVLLLARKGNVSSGRLAAVATFGSFMGMLVLNRTCPMSHEASHILPLHVGAVLLALVAGASLPRLNPVRSP